MAQHRTHKSSLRGKSATISRRAQRAVKYATQPLDVERILSTLDRPLAVAR
jgi:hypothetical protein